MDILNKRISPEAFGVYVGRPSRWGNPFEICPGVTREAACSAFESWAFSPEQASFREDVRQHLRGNNLICWCFPKRCHAETLRKIALTKTDADLFRVAPLFGL